MPDWILLFFTPFFNLLLYNKMSIMTNSFIITSLWFGLPSLFSSPTDNLKKKSPLWLSAKHSEGGAAEWVGLQSGRGWRVGGAAEWAGSQSGWDWRVGGAAEWAGLQSGSFFLFSVLQFERRTRWSNRQGEEDSKLITKLHVAFHLPKVVKQTAFPWSFSKAIWPGFAYRTICPLLLVDYF